MAFGSGGIVTGLDVGVTSVKAATLKHGKGSPQLIGLAIAEVDAAGDRTEASAQAIRAALDRGGAGSNTPVISVVGGPGVSVKHVTFPEMPRQTLAESIRWEARKHVPFGGSDFVLDFQTLNGADRGGSGELHVLLAAVETKLLDAHIATLGKAGIEPDVVDLTPLALINEVEGEELLNGDALAIIDLGVTALSMSIYRRNGLFFARSVPLVARSAEISAKVPEDEAVDVAGKTAAKGRKKGHARGHAKDGKKEPVAHGGWKKTLLREVRRSLTFYNNETGKQGIDRIYLTGGRALEPGIDRTLESDLGVATEVLNPLDRVRNGAVDTEDLKREGPRFAVAMGLARRG